MDIKTLIIRYLSGFICLSIVVAIATLKATLNSDDEKDSVEASLVYDIIMCTLWPLTILYCALFEIVAFLIIIFVEITSQIDRFKKWKQRRNVENFKKRNGY